MIVVWRPTTTHHSGNPKITDEFLISSKRPQSAQILGNTLMRWSVKIQVPASLCRCNSRSQKEKSLGSVGGRLVSSGLGTAFPRSQSSHASIRHCSTNNAKLLQQGAPLPNPGRLAGDYDKKGLAAMVAFPAARSRYPRCSEPEGPEVSDRPPRPATWPAATSPVDRQPQSYATLRSLRDRTAQALRPPGHERHGWRCRRVPSVPPLSEVRL